MVKQKTREYDIVPVYAPVGGLAGHVPPTMLKPEFCSDCLNVRFKNGEVIKRTGYVAYGTGTIEGLPLGVYCYRTWDGTERVILATTSHVYMLMQGAWGELVSGLTGQVDTRVSMCLIQNTLIFANTNDVAKKLSVVLNIGSSAISRQEVTEPGETVVDKNNPAVSNGTIELVEIYAADNLANVVVASFSAAGNVLTARDHHVIGSVDGGYKQSFGVDITVVTGDYIGVYCEVPS